MQGIPALGETPAARADFRKRYAAALATHRRLQREADAGGESDLVADAERRRLAFARTDQASVPPDDEQLDESNPLLADVAKRRKAAAELQDNAKRSRDVARNRKEEPDLETVVAGHVNSIVADAERRAAAFGQRSR